MLSIVKDVNGFLLRDELWCGALDTLGTITQNGKLQDLMSLLEEMYPESVNITTINDLLWFEEDFILEQMGVELADECACTKGLGM